MSAQSITASMITFRFRILLLLLAMLTTPTLQLTGQTVPSRAARDSAIESHFAAAQQAQRDKDYATAEREYRTVLALAPDFAEVHMNLGLVYQLLDRSAEAMTEFLRAVKFKPGLAGANFFLGVDYCKLGEGAKAVPYLKAALHTESNRPDIWLGLATAQDISPNLQPDPLPSRPPLEHQPNHFYLLYPTD